MSNHIQQARQFVLDTVRQSARQTSSDHGDDQHRRGFTRAAGITLDCLQEKIDAFTEQMKGSGLTKSEQAIYTQLEEVKSEIEADYDRYWRGTSVDWRPRTTVAKGTVRPTGERQA